MDLEFGVVSLSYSRIMNILYFSSIDFVLIFLPFKPHRLYFAHEVRLQCYFFPKGELIVLLILLNDLFLCLKCFQIPKFSFKGPHVRLYFLHPFTCLCTMLLKYHCFGVYLF